MRRTERDGKPISVYFGDSTGAMRAVKHSAALPERPIEAKLGPVVVGDGREVICVGLSERLLALAPLPMAERPAPGSSPARRGLPHAFQALVERIDGFLEACLGIAGAFPSRLHLGKSLCDFGRDAILHAKDIDHRRLVLGLPFLDPRPVAEAEILNLPDDLRVPIAPRAEMAPGRVDAPAEDSPAQAGIRRGHAAGARWAGTAESFPA